MLPEVKRYFDTLETLQADCNKRHDELVDAEGAEERKVKRDAWRASNTRYADGCVEAAEKLGEETEDKLIAYMVDNFLTENTSEVNELLKIAHQGFDAMAKLAKEESWCGQWTRSVLQAHEDGALELTVIQLLRVQLEDNLADDMGTHDAKAAMELVDSLIKAHVEEAVANLAKTANVVVDALTK